MFAKQIMTLLVLVIVQSSIRKRRDWAKIIGIKSMQWVPSAIQENSRSPFTKEPGKLSSSDEFSLALSRTIKTPCQAYTNLNLTVSLNFQPRITILWF